MAKEQIVVRVAGKVVFDQARESGSSVEVTRMPLREEWGSRELLRVAEGMLPPTLFTKVDAAAYPGWVLSLRGDGPSRVLLYLGTGGSFEEFRPESWATSILWKVADAMETARARMALSKAYLG